MEHQPRRDQETHQAARIVAGNCPRCGYPMVIFNNNQEWPIAKCMCGWRGATTQIIHRERYEELWPAEKDGVKGWAEEQGGRTEPAKFWPADLKPPSDLLEGR